MKFLEPFLAVIGAVLLIMFGCSCISGANYQFGMVGILLTLALAYGYAWFRSTSSIKDEIACPAARGGKMAIAVAVCIIGAFVLVKTSTNTSERYCDLRAVFDCQDKDNSGVMKDFLAVHQRLIASGFSLASPPGGFGVGGGLVSQGMQTFWYQSPQSGRQGLRIRVDIHPEMHHLSCSAMLYGSGQSEYDRAVEQNTGFLKQLTTEFAHIL